MKQSPMRLPALLALGAIAACGDDTDGPAQRTGPENDAANAAEPSPGGGGAAAAESPSAGGTGPAIEPGAAAGSGGAALDDGAPTGAGGSPAAAGAGPDTAPVADFVPGPEDFDCIAGWPQVRSFRITNKAGHLQEALDVAAAPEGRRYPVGTFIQLVPFEAMVKRGPGFSAETNDWEFFFLSVSPAGTVIESRGTTNVVNQFGGNCFDCHRQADPRFDFVCEQSNGCVPLPLTPALIQSLQQGDPRCP